MRSDFVEGAYNPDAHAFSEWPDERLQNRLNELHENNRSIGYTGERLTQVQREMTNIAFEMAERLRDAKNQQIEEAWSDYERI